ncbi:hypothetical protein G5I_03559 [Acromyrmex echinatior]|uniref:Uncharacterized protein n=1 Tax=Acromyrmex echinatior TaxID=103372 RepID=F4WDA6_ACREC|nr:hypothetical protein G5I_03559 [Acromyrmex echinatior]
MMWKSISFLGHAREERFTFEHLRCGEETRWRPRTWGDMAIRAVRVAAGSQHVVIEWYIFKGMEMTMQLKRLTTTIINHTNVKRFSVEFIIAYVERNYYFIPPLRQLLRNGLHFEFQITLRDC